MIVSREAVIENKIIQSKKLIMRYRSIDKNISFQKLNKDKILLIIIKQCLISKTSTTKWKDVRTDMKKIFPKGITMN